MHVALWKRNCDLNVRQVNHLDNRTAFFHPLPDLGKFLRNPSIERSQNSGFVEQVSDALDFSAELSQSFSKRAFLGQGRRQIAFG